MERAAFVTQFPEFEGVETALLDAVLAAAALEVDVEVWGAKASQGIAYKAARKLALSPLGNTAKLVNKDGSTVYDRELDRLVRQVASGFRVTL